MCQENVTTVAKKKTSCNNIKNLIGTFKIYRYSRKSWRRNSSRKEEKNVH